MGKIELPKGAAAILETLEAHGFSAYVVGGCVRDSLLGLKPQDWDVCTSALPHQVEALFPGRRVLETGVRHGTVTVVMEDGPYEVTTFREDGAYSDFRRPDSVSFVEDVQADLARRDFTVNAMAYNGRALLDPYGGAHDLARRVIACVGDPDARFCEDALRMMRALRFAAVYGFAIAPETARSIHQNKALLAHIAAERLRAELSKLLLGAHSLSVLLDFSDVMAEIIPEFGLCIGFEQHSSYHAYTVYDHMMYAAARCRSDALCVRLAAFLHDIGKPLCYTEDEKGGHFRGHAGPGAEIAKAVMERLRFDHRTRDAAAELILYHDAVLEPTAKSVRRWLHRLGEERFRQLIALHEADTLAQAAHTQGPRLRRLAAIEPVLEEVLREAQCFSRKDMKLDGNDLLALGVPKGRRVGEILQTLLDRVIAGELPNDRALLLRAAEKLISGETK